MRWVHRYAPELEKRARRFQGYGSTSWRIDETYVKVGGRWKYLFRAVDKYGVLTDFMLLERKNTRAAHRLLSKALTTMQDWPASSITADKLRSCPEAIERLKREGKLSRNAKHRTSKYLNNIIEMDPWCSQASYSSRVPDHEVCYSNHQKLRDHAHNPTWLLPSLQAWSKDRNALRQLTVWNRRVITKCPHQGTIRLQQVNATEPHL